MHPLTDTPFAKMNGIGNQILVLDGRSRALDVTAEDARRLGRGPLAFDQMMVLRQSARPGFDARVDIFNTDGSRAGACGNGTRCVAWVLLQGSDRTRTRLDIEGADVACRRDGAWLFTVDMGPPRLGWHDIPLREAADTQALDLGPVLAEQGLDRPAAVSMGNPHAIFFVPDLAGFDLGRLGPLFEHHPMFPDRANISFARVLAPDHIGLKVWERGAGATKACGSAACATLVAAAQAGLTGRAARISLPGGDLHIVWRSDDHVTMTGLVELERAGRLAPDLFGSPA